MDAEKKLILGTEKKVDRMIACLRANIGEDWRRRRPVCCISATRVASGSRPSGQFSKKEP